MNIASLTRTACWFFLFLVCPALALSQGFQGTIRGSVLDPSGALIPGATVTLTSAATGESHNQLSSETGTFNFPNLLVADYTVFVELPGFKKYTRENIQVTANHIENVQVRLEVGGITDEVVVTTGEEGVNVSSSQLLGITTRRVVDLPNPVPSGNPNNLAILAPGTTTMPGGVQGLGGSIGGNRPRNNNFIADGVDNNDPTSTGPLTPVIADAVQEFTLITNQFNPEYGHSTAGQFITTTKSGGNDFHGGGWWYNQNRHTNSLDNLTRASTPPGGAKPRYDWNRFGGEIGGPIVENRWFFSTAYEYQNKTLARTSSAQILVPTQAGLSTLQSLANAAGTGISPVNVNILTEHVPLAATQTTTANVTDEGTGTLIPIGLGPFVGVTPNFDRTHLFMGNSDFTIGKHRLSGRYSYSRNPLIVAGPLPTEEFNSNASINTQRIVFSDVFFLGSRTVNEFRAGYNRKFEDRSVTPPPPSGNNDVFGNYTINDIGLPIGPTVSPVFNKNHIYLFSNTTTMTGGAHTVKFGAEIRNIIANSNFLSRPRGDYAWTSFDEFVHDRFPTARSLRGVGIGTFAQNRTATYFFAQDSWKIHPRITLEYGLRYEFTTTARDSNLHDLNGISNVVSIRNEVYAPENTPSSNPGLLGTVIFDSLPAHHQEAILFQFGEQLIFRRPSPDKNNFAPRLGLAWDLFGDGKTSLRAGAGIAHDVVYANMASALPAPQISSTSSENNACSFAPIPAWCAFVTNNNPDASPNIRYSNIGFIEGGALLPFLSGTRINRYIARNSSAAWLNPKEKSPETYTWSVSVQREQFEDWTFELRYVGNHSVFLPIQRHQSPRVPNPVRLPFFLNSADALAANFAGASTLADFNAGTTNRLLTPYGLTDVLTTFGADGQSWYHGFSISAERRMTRGLFVNTSYTWSKTIDIIENDFATSALNPRRLRDAYNPNANKGLSGLHRAHKFVASWIYELPNYPASGFLSHVLNQWQFIGSYIVESGQPVSILSFIDTNGDGDSVGDTAVFNAGGQRNVGSDVNKVCWDGTTTSIVGASALCPGTVGATASNQRVVAYAAVNPNAQYIRAREGMVTNLSRNTFIMPGIHTANLSLFKNFDLWEDDKELQFRIEMFNAFNHPSHTLGSGTVLPQTGQTHPAQTATAFVTPGTSTFLNHKTISGGMGNAPFQRIIQWGLKFLF